MSDTAFKNTISPDVAIDLGERLKAVAPEFDLKGYKKEALRDLETLELKARVIQVADALAAHFDDYASVVNAILKSFSSVSDPNTDAVSRGMIYWPYLTVVERHGLNDYARSLDALHALTCHWSAEFAIRPFLDADRDAVEPYLKKWTTDSSEHVRRLVSEGSRPLLPWGIRLNGIKDDPKWSVDLLKPLRDDPSEYVRRSVANHLNDISKHHPEVVTGVGKRWMKGASRDRERLVKHALRTLFKKGDADALSIFGFEPPKVTLETLTCTPVVTSTVPAEFSVVLSAESSGKWMVDYAIHYVKANGKTSPKVFKWFTVEPQKGDRIERTKTQSFKTVSTRKHYEGVHEVEIFVNGLSVGSQPFAFEP